MKSIVRGGGRFVNSGERYRGLVYFGFEVVMCCIFY